tara:strand:- start:63989 stop:64192 length:204 start_codon:yes stop_codon:yes gene_type:complete
MKNKKRLVKNDLYNRKVSRIIEIELLLTSLVIKNRGKKNFQPHTGDKYQPLRDEVKKLRIELGILKK